MRGQNKTALYMVVLVVSLIVSFALALTIGKYNVTLDNLIALISGNLSQESTEYKVIMNLRLPRTIVAASTGVALSLSGLLYQETFQNKLVSPDFLGVTSGASVGAAIAILLGFASWQIGALAFVLGLITVMITLTLSRCFRNNSPTILLLSGIIVGGLMSAVLSFIKYLADPESTLSMITFWMMGSCEWSTMSDVRVLLPLVAICAAFVLLIRWRINLVSLGREEAQTKGLNYKYYKRVIIIVSTLMTACAVSIVGSVGWIGLVIPHMSRLLVGTNTANTIPITIVFGAVFMIIADVISRAFTSSEIPLSAITGLFGTVIFIAILYFRRRAVLDDSGA